MKSTSFCLIIVSRFLDYICINVTNYGYYQCIQLYALGGTHQFVRNYASNCMHQYKNHELKRRQTWMLNELEVYKEKRDAKAHKIYKGAKCSLHNHSIVLVV